MTVHPFPALAPEYESWVAHCRPLPERVAEIDHIARRLTTPAALARLGTIFAQTGIPIVCQAVKGERECGFDFTKNWGQGDPLTRPSTHVPKGRPPLGAPPNDHFPVSWEWATLDAFTVCDRLNVISVPAWTLPYAVFKDEGYNGFGYRAHGVRTPYVLGGTNLQQPGKYVADGVFDPNHMDTQLGTLPVMMRMIELIPSLAFGPPPPIVAPSIVTDVTPLPIGVGRSLTGTKWFQSSANLILRLDPPLLVDGSFGRRSRDACRQLEGMFGLPQDGVIDDELCSAIDARLATMRPNA